MSEGKKPCLLVTGAAGALAQQVIRRLRQDYRLVVCDARREVSMPVDIPSYHVDFNKRDFEDLFREYRFDGIVHLGRIGPNDEVMDLLSFRTSKDLMDKAPPLFTGDKEVDFPGDYSGRASVAISCEDDLPFTLAAMMLDVTTHEG